jgi:hypothetical protein
MPTEDEEKLTTAAFLSKAHARFKLCADAESENRRKALADLEFAKLSKQWPDDIQTQRAADGTPCLTLNQLGKFIRQVCNEQRQQRPAIQINPVGDGADKETAEVLQGMIRHIEVNSDAEIADDVAFDFAVTTGGPGWIRAITEYVDDDSDDQEIKLVPITNPFTVYCDPRASKPNREDAKFLFVVEDIPTETYQEDYPDSAMATLADYTSIGDMPPTWMSKESIRVAEYFYSEEKTEKPKGDKKRPRIVRTWHWAKITAKDILDQRELKGKFHPFFPCYAEETNVNGKRYYKGLVRDAMDPQRQYNYHCSAATEAVGIGTKAPWLITDDQVENLEDHWKQANVRKLAFLKYHYVQGAPPPTRNATEPPIQAMMLLVRQAGEDLMSSTGLYNPSLGKQQSPDESGKAILAQQQQGDIATLNYSDNLKRTKKHIGRYLIDQIPFVYDAPRIQRIIKPDESISHVGVFNSNIHKMSPEEAQASLQEAPEAGPEAAAIKKVFDIGVGRYDVVVDVGPTYQTKRKEASATQLALMGEVPIVAQAAPDLIIRNMDIPGADAIADRVKMLLPPQLLANDGDDPQGTIQKLQSQLTALTQQHQAAAQLVQQLQQKVESKQVETQGKIAIVQIEAQLKTRMFQMEQEAKILIAQIEAKSQDADARARETMQVWAELHSSAHDAALSQQQHQQALEQGQQSAVAASAQSAQDASQANAQAMQQQSQPQGAQQ